MFSSADVSAWMLAAALAAAAVPLGRAETQTPPRDSLAPKTDAPSGASVSGRVLAADTGRAVRRARVLLTAAELPGGRAGLTDDTGAFALADLPAGRYTLAVSKTGFVSLSYGQRRPLQAGTPLQLASGQQITGLEFRLPRGSVMSGHVFDETGEAAPGIMVRVLRYQYIQGDRRLVTAGTSQTDDRGQYRVWGLMPGDYYVDAQARINLGLPGGGRGGPGGRAGPGAGMAGAIAGAIGAVAGNNLGALFAPADDDSQKAYAPTYFPGVTAIADARPVTLGLSQESSDIDFGLQLVHVGHVKGRVVDPGGTPTWSGTVTLAGENATGAGGRGGGGFGVSYGGRIQWDGTFDIGNVPPGRYTLQARGMDAETPQFGAQPLMVADGDVEGLTIQLAAGARITGTIVFGPGQTTHPDLSSLRVTAPATDSSAGGVTQGRVDKDGGFTIDGLAAGPHLIRVNGNTRGWTLRSVTAGGRDVTDLPIELRSGERLDRVEIALTDRTSAITGTIADERNSPVTDYTVLAFSTDTAFWQAQSRHIATARPDQTGTFKIASLPPGGYYVATVDPAEQGEWFEPAYLEQHRLSAARVDLGEGETKTQDFRIRAQN
jgi:protocatechuate 3,4-dioxygenase beta subunit